jgi:hypothetical protein
MMGALIAAPYARKLRAGPSPTQAVSSNLQRLSARAREDLLYGQSPLQTRGFRLNNGGGEIRTLGTPIRRTTVFESLTWRPDFWFARAKMRLARASSRASTSLQF